MTKLTILSTKKLSGSFRSALEPEHIFIEEEFISINPLPPAVIQPDIIEWAFAPKKVSVVFTSRHAVIDFNEFFYVNGQWHLPDWQVFCLSGATKKAVQEKLPHVAIAGEAEDAASLASIIASAEVKDVIFFCGNKRRDELPDILEEHGIIVREVVVYESEINPITIVDPVDVILFFSPSAVESYFYANRVKPETTCVAIGKTTANAIREYTRHPVIVSSHPNQESMLKTVLDITSTIKMKNGA